MVNLQSYYENVDVSANTSHPLANRVTGLLDQVITRLPDEEQFRIMGTIFIDSIDAVVNFCKERNFDNIPGLSSILQIKDGNLLCDFHEELENSEFTIILAIDRLDEKSDDYIMGLIAYKISGWSYTWKAIKERWHESMEPNECMIIMSKIPPAGSEEYERNVDAEAKRLGFAKELLAYDTQS